MRLPVACNDAQLLEDEPFCSAFVACAAANPSHNGGEQRRQRLHAVATQELQAEPDGVCIFPLNVLYLYLILRSPFRL